MKIRIQSEANFDFAECLRYYIDEETPSTAARFAERVDESYEQIIETPERFVPDKNGLRRKPIKGFPEHSVIYRIKDGLIEIVSIRHHKRNPGFWNKRL